MVRPMSTQVRAERETKAKPNHEHRSGKGITRPHADAHTALQRAADASPQTHRMARLQRTVGASPQVQRLVQLQAIADSSPRSTASLAADTARALPGNVRTKMECALGMDFSSVRIHEGPQATAMDAIAYTQGRDVHFAPGYYRPHSQSGQELLGHELAHVVQQAEGRVSATRQLKGVGLNDADHLEREADAMGRAAALGRTISRASDLQPPAPSGAAPIQRRVVPQISTALTPQAQAATQQELQNAYDAAWAHLWTNPLARHIYTIVHAHANDINVYVGASNTNVARNGTAWDLDFNPWFFGALGDQLRRNFPGAATNQIQAAPRDLTGTISPAMLLLHEFGHVKQDIETEQFSLNNATPGAAAAFTDFEHWLRAVHGFLLRLFGQTMGLVQPVLADPHSEVMENDNVTRHERPTQVAMGEPTRAAYHNTLVFNDLDVQAKRIMTGMGLDPAMRAANLGPMVRTTFNIHHAPIPMNVDSVLTHIADLQQHVQALQAAHAAPGLPNWKQQARQADLVNLANHLAAAHAFWTNLGVQDAAAAQVLVPARPAPTYQAP